MRRTRVFIPPFLVGEFCRISLKEEVGGGDEETISRGTNRGKKYVAVLEIDDSGQRVH